MTVELASVKVQCRHGLIDFRYHARAGQEVEDILKGRVYPRLPFLADARVVVDVGSSVGAAALFFSDLYSDAIIYGFEPHRESYEIALANTAGVAAVRLFNLGLYDEDREADLYIGDKTHSTNSVFAGALHNSARTEPVRLRRASTLLAAEGVEAVDILKIDTEGCEVPILRDLLGAYSPKAVHFEYHSEPDRRALDGMLAGDYLLYAGRADWPHLGTMTYVRKDAFPSAAERDRQAVNLRAKER